MTDMPWVNLTQKEIEELRRNKRELTAYGKQKIKELKLKQNEVINKEMPE